MRIYKSSKFTEGDLKLPKKEWNTLFFLAHTNETGDYTPTYIELPYTEDEFIKKEFVRNFAAEEISSYEERSRPFLFGYFTIVKHLAVYFEDKEIPLIDHRHNDEDVCYIFDTLEANKTDYILMPYKDIPSRFDVSKYLSKDYITQEIQERPDDLCFICHNEIRTFSELKSNGFVYVKKKFVLLSEL